jgi:aspartyl-tRNA(Asn)/glutamyl-tRNA(Gln) amidotransferase subunit A
MFSSIADLHTALRSGAVTCRAVTEYYLGRITEYRHLNAYTEVFEESALQQADALDAQLKAHPQALGRMFGVVVSIKDLICYASHRVSAGSKILEGFVSQISSTAVERLLAEGAIIIGRTNCDEFGMGSSNENSAFGPVRNGLAEERVPGGSSGGAAVALQMNLCLVALGSDTGGSVRQPAALCGIWGYKPAYGRISRHGLIAYGSSFDQIGIFANGPEDVSRTLQVIAGPDAFDSTALTARLPEEIAADRQPRRIAYLASALDSPGMDTGVRQRTWEFIEQLRQCGHQVEPVKFDLLDYIIPTYYVLTTAEASSNLARFDGIRYGYRSTRTHNLEETYLLSRSEGFGPEVRRRIILGTYVLSSGYYDAYYTKAQQARRLIQERVLSILEEADFILMPASPTVAWRFGEKTKDPVAMYLSDIFTVLASLAGVPAVSVPVGLHPDNQMPVGVQLMSGAGADAALLAFCKSLEA